MGQWKIPIDVPVAIEMRFYILILGTGQVLAHKQVIFETYLSSLIPGGLDLVTPHGLSNSTASCSKRFMSSSDLQINESTSDSILMFTTLGCCPDLVRTHSYVLICKAICYSALLDIYLE